MAKCYQLIGVPASGKSTWVKLQDWAKDIPVVSTDRFVDEYAEKMGKTYNEVFEEYMPIAVKLMANQVLICKANNKDVIWDQTSVSVASRRKKFNMLPDYEHIAVVFKTPEMSVLKERLASRPGKNIPSHVMVQMIRGFVMPTKDEGFTEIRFG